MILPTANFSAKNHDFELRKAKITIFFGFPSTRTRDPRLGPASTPAAVAELQSGIRTRTRRRPRKPQPSRSHHKTQIRNRIRGFSRHP
jgi:hypothetical protein